MHQVESYSNGHSLNGKFAFDIFGFTKRILFYLCKLMHSQSSARHRNLYDSSVRTASKQIVQMSSLYEDTTYFLRISMHPYLPCWGRSLDLQRIKNGGFVGTAFRVTVSLSKHTTTTSIANYKELGERGTTLSPVPASPSLHSAACKGTDRPQLSLSLALRTIR